MTCSFCVFKLGSLSNPSKLSKTKKNSKQNTSQDKFLKQMLGFGYSHYMDGISWPLFIHADFTAFLLDWQILYQHYFKIKVKSYAMHAFKIIAPPFSIISTKGYNFWGGYSCWFFSQFTRASPCELLSKLKCQVAFCSLPFFMSI